MESFSQIDLKRLARAVQFKDGLPHCEENKG